MNKYKTVDEFLEGVGENKKQQVLLLREIIQSAEPKLTEHIKWNAPSYVLDDEDRITFNVFNKANVVKIVLHMGAVRKENKKGTPILDDKTGLIEWSSDIRGMLTFDTLEDISSKQDELSNIFKRWLEIAS